MSTIQIQYPKLRALDIRPVVKDDRPCIALRDPLQLTDNMLVVPQPLGLVLSLCDGTRENARALSISVMVRYGLRIAPHVIDHLLEALDQSVLLENDTFVQTRERVLAEYRQAPFRAPFLADQSYPADEAKLRQVLQTFDALDEANDSSEAPEIRGLISPHIDYARGGPVYARVWTHAAKAARAADLAIILGTDHFGADSQLTFTRQNYATPFGVLPTAREVVDVLAGAIGEEQAFAGELHHRSEHSVELAAVWLHYVRRGRPCEVVPVLCGSFHPFIAGEADPEQDAIIRSLLEAYEQATAGHRVLVVAAGDMAHVGPAFGGQPLDMEGRAHLQAADDELIELMCAGDAAGFLAAIERAGDQNNVCGVPPIYLALRLLEPAHGQLLAYDSCPADENDTSAVTVCGMVLE